MINFSLRKKHLFLALLVGKETHKKLHPIAPHSIIVMITSFRPGFDSLVKFFARHGFMVRHMCPITVLNVFET